MFDTHCHLTFKEFDGRVGQILADAAAAGVRGAITVATTTADCLRAKALAEQHPNLWHSAGVHPLYSDQPIDWNAYREVACAGASGQASDEGTKCVAWGELGLDNHYDRPARKQQLEVLEKQLAFIAACESPAEQSPKQRSPKDQTSKVQSSESSRQQSPKDQTSKVPTSKLQNERSEESLDFGRLDFGLSSRRRPIIVHSRDSVDDLLAVFRDFPAFEPSRFVFHCFTGGPEEAKRVLDFGGGGAWISFTGVVTFHNAAHVAEAAKLVPVDRMLVETDAPFLTPEPMRKVRPNEPKYVVHVARRIAELKGLDVGDFERQLDANVQRFFGIEF